MNRFQVKKVYSDSENAVMITETVRHKIGIDQMASIEQRIARAATRYSKGDGNDDPLENKSPGNEADKASEAANDASKKAESFKEDGQAASETDSIGDYVNHSAAAIRHGRMADHHEQVANAHMEAHRAHKKAQELHAKSDDNANIFRR
jgi:hypothetical protein